MYFVSCVSVYFVCVKGSGNDLEWSRSRCAFLVKGRKYVALQVITLIFHWKHVACMHFSCSLALQLQRIVTLHLAPDRLRWMSSSSSGETQSCWKGRRGGRLYASCSRMTPALTRRCAWTGSFATTWGCAWETSLGKALLPFGLVRACCICCITSAEVFLPSSGTLE